MEGTVERDPPSSVTAPQASVDPAASTVSLNPSSEIALYFFAGFFYRYIFIDVDKEIHWIYLIKMILLDLNFLPSICPQRLHILPQLCMLSNVWV